LKEAVAGVMSEIAAASAEQATGIEQVNKALNQMDEVTQQNSALVKENAATAKTLESQAEAMNFLLPPRSRRGAGSCEGTNCIFQDTATCRQAAIGKHKRSGIQASCGRRKSRPRCAYAGGPCDRDQTRPRVEGILGPWPASDVDVLIRNIKSWAGGVANGLSTLMMHQGGLGLGKSSGRCSHLRSWKAKVSYRQFEFVVIK
jgi:hypothetical protein